MAFPLRSVLETKSLDIELVSPTSINEVLELKDCMETLNSYKEYWEVNQATISEILERFVCVTDMEGRVKYSNFKELAQSDEIIEKLNLKSKAIQRIQDELLKKEMPENIETFLNGHICLITVNQQRVPSLLKIQSIMDEEERKLLIWTLKKVSIEESSGPFAFSLDDDLNLTYKFLKFKFVLAINQSGNIVYAPYDFFKYIFRNNIHFNPKKIDDILFVPDELKYALETSYDASDCYQKFSASSLDLAVEESFSLKPILSAMTRLKSQSEMIVSVNLFNSIQSKDNETVFPIQIKYQYDHDQDAKIMQTEEFPKFPGFNVIRKLSESLNSSVYEAVKFFQPNYRVIIKKIHARSQTIQNELKFYDYFNNDPMGCEFIEKPIRVEVEPNPTIYMQSKSNQVDLFEYINSNPYLPDKDIQTMFFQIAKAVEYLHNNRIIHRDLKDENILIDTSNLSVKLIDFGSSAFLDDIEKNFTEYAGTLSYAPVEVLKGHAFKGPEQDIWCLGILLYVLCFKEPPFHSPKEIMQGYLRLPIERPANCIQLIRSMLDPKPDNRPNIKTILQNEFLIQ